MTEAEFGVIGCVLIDNDVLNSIWRTLKPEMFSSDFAQDTYKEMLAMYDRNENIDPMSLSMALENHKYTQEQISELMKSCITGTITSTMVKSYADAVAKEYKARMVRRTDTAPPPGRHCNGPGAAHPAPKRFSSAHTPAHR